jgi:hypothetical protein
MKPAGSRWRAYPLSAAVQTWRDGSLFYPNPRLHVSKPPAGESPVTGSSGALRIAGAAGQFNAQHTTWISDSIGDLGRKGEMAGMWQGTRSERANLAAIHHARKPLQTYCSTRLHIRP